MGQTRKARDRSAVLWCLGVVVAAQVGLTASIETWRPTWGDPEYGYRQTRLRRLHAEHPDRKLLVAFGSSRTINGFASDLPVPGVAEESLPIPFTMGTPAGGGPSSQLIILRRLLAQGIKPDEVTFEAFYPFLGYDGAQLRAPNPFLKVRLPDLDIIRRHAPSAAPVRYRQWLAWNTLPWYSYRFPILARHFPDLVPSHLQVEIHHARKTMSPHGWRQLDMLYMPAKDYAITSAIAQQTFRDLQTPEPLDPTTDAMWHELLQTCQREGIRVVSITAMPEGEDFRKLYTAEQAEFGRAYFTKLCAQYGTQFVDARAWVPTEQFFDGHHLLACGAKTFMTRFWHDVYLQPTAPTPTRVALHAD